MIKRHNCLQSVGLAGGEQVSLAPLGWYSYFICDISCSNAVLKQNPCLNILLSNFPNCSKVHENEKGAHARGSLAIIHKNTNFK